MFDLITDSSRTISGVRDGDIIEFVLETKILNNDNLVSGGIENFFTAYVSDGVEIIGTSGLVSDACGVGERESFICF